jgi:galactokinase
MTAFPAMPGAAAKLDFERLFGAAPDATASAPGRVNLIGEHTDYHDGFVLPTTIPQRTTVELRRRADRVVRIASTSMESVLQQFVIGREQRGCGWLDYVQGVTSVLGKRGYDITGFDACISSGVPVGAGVSSSAALLVALMRALREAGEIVLDDRTIAVLSRAAETEFVGAPVGIMDQIACSLGRDGHALFLDTRSLEFRRVPLPPSVALVVIHSGMTHHHAGGAYVARRKESMAAAQQLGVTVLRDCGLERLADLDKLPPLLARRARHVITENDRVGHAATALLEDDPAACGVLMEASHTSLRDDYEVSTPEIDTLVDLADAEDEVFGARLTGGGFGGSVVMLVRAGTAAAIASRVAAAYAAKTGKNPTVLVPADRPAYEND